MFFLRMIFRSFSRQFKRRLLIAVTVCLSATVSVAMLGVVFDVGDKLNAELSTYGSNIIVQPKLMPSSTTCTTRVVMLTAALPALPNPIRPHF